MVKFFSNPSTPAGQKTWLGLGLVGIAAMTAGVLLPQMLPGSVPEAKAPVPAPKDAGGLAYSPPAWPETPDARSMLLRLGLGTGVVLTLAVGTLWGCKRWLRIAPAAAGSPAHMRLVETLSLGNRCCVHLLHVGSRQVLAAMDGGGLKSLVALPESFEHALGETQGEELSGHPSVNSAV